MNRKLAPGEKLHGLWSILLLLVFVLQPAALQAEVSQATPTGPIAQLNRCGSGDETSFTLAAVGDILLHMYIQDVAEQRGYDYLFRQVRPLLQRADMPYANFEGNANRN